MKLFTKKIETANIFIFLNSCTLTVLTDQYTLHTRYALKSQSHHKTVKLLHSCKHNRPFSRDYFVSFNSWAVNHYKDAIITAMLSHFLCLREAQHKADIVVEWGDHGQTISLVPHTMCRHSANSIAWITLARDKTIFVFLNLLWFGSTTHAKTVLYF